MACIGCQTSFLFLMFKIEEIKFKFNKKNDVQSDYFLIFLGDFTTTQLPEKMIAPI